MLVDNEATLEKYLQVQTCAVHCEDEATIKSNLENIKQSLVKTYLLLHTILSDLKKLVIFLLQRRSLLPKKTGARLHVFHLSTTKEMSLFTNKIPLEERKLPEVCIHHLWFYQ
jgi:dihydroorotase